MSSEPWRTCGDTRERLELLAQQVIEQALGGTLQLPEPSEWQPVRDVVHALREAVRPAWMPAAPLK